MNHNLQSKKNITFGVWIGVLTSVLTIISFILAITALPKSGADCTGECVSYPYLNITNFFPGDYYWMSIAILMILSYLILVICIHTFASDDKKLFSHIGLNFAFMSTMILVVDYFIQLTVVQQSLIHGQTDGISLITQYNPYGIFISLEDIGYLLMSVGFLFLAFIYSSTSRIEQSIKLLFVVNFLLTVLALVLSILLFGIDIQYRFEIAAITINWFTLIITGFLEAKYLNQEYIQKV